MIALDKVQIPKTMFEALKDPKWRAAIMEEYHALERNGTWILFTLPSRKCTIGCEWIFSIKKKKVDWSIERFKSRLVAKGYTQSYGIDYQETFSFVAKLNTIRVLLSIVANQDWPLFQLDVKNAFLNGYLVEEFHMDIPPGFETEYNRGNV